MSAMDPQTIIARRIAQELRSGMLVNLGIGIPTMVANYVPSEVKVFFQSENGLIGTGPIPEQGMGHRLLTDAGGRPVTALPGACTFDSAMSFGLIRGGHVDITVLGALQVDAHGLLADALILPNLHRLAAARTKIAIAWDDDIFPSLPVAAQIARRTRGGLGSRIFRPARITTVSQIGDLWLLGSHRLQCGDARGQAAYDQLLAGAKAEFVFTDPPYNVVIDGHVCGLGRVRHREFAMGCGEMSEAEFTAFLKTVFALLADNSIDGSIHQICMDWRHIWEMLEAGRTVYGELKNLCVWNKTNAGMGSFYRSKHELVFIWKSGTAAHINNFELGQHGRHRSNVWDYPGVNTMRPGRLEELAMHPTIKPVALVADAIKDCSRRGGLVLDPFCGSGTILIAAERTGRKARGLEIDPIYVDVAVQRWQAYTGKSAILVGSGETFETTAERRAKAAA
jgi:DNA modification methylase